MASHLNKFFDEKDLIKMFMFIYYQKKEDIQRAIDTLIIEKRVSWKVVPVSNRESETIRIFTSLTGKQFKD